MTENWIFLKQETDELRKLQDEQKFVFNIHPQLTKTEVKRWIEESFLVKVVSLNTQRITKKEKRRGRHIAYPVRYKTIIVRIDLNTNPGNVKLNDSSLIKKETSIADIIPANTY